MELILFIVFLSLSLLLVTLGLIKSEHSELALVGFGFLFIMSLIIINGDIQYKTGTKEVYVYGNNYTGYHWDYVIPGPPVVNDVNLFHSNQTNIYSSMQDISIAGGFFFHLVGYWLAVCSIVGFVGVLAGLKANIRK